MSINITGYQLGREVSTGRFFTLYNALEEKNSNPVSVRIFNRPSAYSERFVKRFEAESAKLIQRQLGVMVPVKGAGVTEDGCYVVSDYFPSFQRQAESSGQFPFNRLLDFAFQLACTLDMIHQLGLIHGGVEVASLYFPDNSHIVLGPVAFHRILADPVDDTLSAESDDLTYMAPEVWQTGLSPATDFYALGVALYELLFRRKPFLASDPLQLQQLQRETEVQIPDARFAHLLPLFKSLLSVDPGHRIHNAQMFEQVLQQCGVNLDKPAFAAVRQALPAERKGITTGLSRKGRSRVKIVGLGVLCIVAFLGYYLLTGGQETEQKPRRNLDQLRNSNNLLSGLNKSAPGENASQPPASVPAIVRSTPPNTPQEAPPVREAPLTSSSEEALSGPVLEAPRMTTRQSDSHDAKADLKETAQLTTSSAEQEAPRETIEETRPKPAPEQQDLYQQAVLQLQSNNLDSALSIINRLLATDQNAIRATQLRMEIEQEIAIRDLIGKANQQLQAGKASKPYGDNALRTYRELELILGKEDERVQQGYRDIAVFYHDRAKLLFERQQIGRSRTFLERGLSVIADFGPLIQLRQQIQQYQADQQALQAKAVSRQQLELQQQREKELAERARARQQRQQALQQEQLKQQKISTLLSRGRRILRADRQNLATLSDAGDIYDEVTQLEPNHAESFQYRQQIVDAYVLQSDRLSAAGDLDAAMAMVSAGLKFADQNSVLLQLKQRINIAMSKQKADKPAIESPATEQQASPEPEKPKQFVPVIGTF